MEKDSLILIAGLCGSGKTTMAFSLMEKDSRILYLSRRNEMKEMKENVSFIETDSDDNLLLYVLKNIKNPDFDTILLDETGPQLHKMKPQDLERFAELAKEFGKVLIFTSQVKMENPKPNERLYTVTY